MMITKINKNKINDKTVKSILMIFPMTLLIFAFILDDFSNIINGLAKIVTHPSVLLTDYLTVGGIGATFVNSALLTLTNIYIVHKQKLSINGSIIAAIFIISGFSFFGKNIINVWPIYIGGLLYTKYQKINFKNVILVTMFGTGISPIVSQISFGMGINPIIGIILGSLFGILIGFILPPVASHMVKVHDGYNIYNIGFTIGLIGTVLIAVLRSYGFIIESKQILSTEYHKILIIIMLAYSVLLIVLGYLLNKDVFKNYKKVFKYSGRLISDFVILTGFEATLVNMGIMGIVSIAYVVISRGTINGPIIGGILTIIGFSAFGKHPKNTIPILIGIFLASFTKVWSITSTSVIIAGLFGTTLAPIAGAFGPYVGIIAGFLHLSVVMNVGFLHGGINLYNNGFSGGIVASLLIPIIDAFNKED